MASLSGSYKATNIATIAAMITLINAQFTAENARMVALGGAATDIIGNLVFEVTANDGSSVAFTHRVNITLNCGSVANTATLMSALSTFATAMETTSAHTTVVAVSANMNTVMTN